MSIYFLILNGGIEHLSMKKRLLELDMLKQQQKKKRPLGRVYSRHIPTRNGRIDV